MKISDLKNLVLFKGKKAKSGPVHTMNITLDNLRAVFFPKDFYEKYRYLGSVPWSSETEMFKYLEPLVIFMDYRAKPWWCPRWFLRFLHLFGNDNSLVRMRSLFLHKLHIKLTKGVFFWDWKTKWHNYDLRISISGDKQMQDFADMIEEHVYRKGRRKEMIEEIKDSKYADEIGDWSSYCDIYKIYEKLVDEQP